MGNRPAFGAERGKERRLLFSRYGNSRTLPEQRGCDKQPRPVGDEGGGRDLAYALDSHFNSMGAMLSEIADSIDMLFERIDNLERRLR